jgi:hypothetical protein
MGSGFCCRGSTFERKLTQRKSRVALTKLCDFLQASGELGELAAAAERLHCAELFVRSPARSNEIGVVRICKPVRPRSSSSHDRALLEGEDGLAGAGKSENVCDRLHALRVCDRMPLAIENAEPASLLCRDASHERRTLDPRGPNLQMGRTWAAQRSTAEERSPDIRSTAARARDDAPRRMVERAQARAEHSGLVQYLKRAFVPFDMQLVTRPPVEGTAAVRPDLRGDAEAAEQAERAARDCRFRQIQVNGNFAPPLQVDAARRVEETRELGQAVAIAPRRYARELVAEILRE